MSFQTLLSLSGVPGLEAGVALLTSTYEGIENIKLYKQQCQDMSARCVHFLVALQENARDLDGRVHEIADEFEIIILRIRRKVEEWGSWSRLKSFLQQRDIKDGIDRLHRDIDAALVKFNISIQLEMTRSAVESKAIQARDTAEIREVLQVIVNSQDDMRMLLDMQASRDSRPVEEMMESLQTHLMDPNLGETEEEVFKAGLWMLHEETAMLPPLTDLTGQVTMTSSRAYAEGSSNDIFRGQWLDREAVALRLPKALAHSQEVQERVEREVAIWRGFNHPNVVPLYGIVYITGDLYSVTPWMDNGTAANYMKKTPHLDRTKLMHDIANGLDYLHRKNIIHGDLRAANVLINKDGVARLSDFGLSKFKEDCAKDSASGSFNTTSLRWSAPELIMPDGRASTYSDVWSFGMTCLEILTGEVPFSDVESDRKVRDRLENGRTPERPTSRMVASHGLTKELWTLLTDCWVLQPELRPTMSELQKRLTDVRSRPKSASSIDTRQGGLKNMFSMFSSQKESRPPTSSSDTQSIASTSGHKIPARIHPSKSSGSTIPVIIPTSHTNGASPSAYRYNHHASGSSWDHMMNFDSGPSLESSPISPLSTNPISPNHNFTRLDIRTGRSPTLEIPSFSQSLPTRAGTYFAHQNHSNSFGSIDSSGGISPVQSAHSADSGIHLSDAVIDATHNPLCILLEADGLVTAGTLEGLVQRLIYNFNSRRDPEYRDVLLTACSAFTTPRTLFDILSRRFFKAQSDHPEECIVTQYNIFQILMYWLKNRFLPPDQAVFSQMNLFCEKAILMKTSSTMIEQARDLQQLIAMHAKEYIGSPRLPLSGLGRRSISGSPNPCELAIGLTLLEGDKYRALTPSDYIVQLTQKNGRTNVEAVYKTHNKIIAWIKDSVLFSQAMDDRAECLKFFINTAQECRKLRNFASLAAIATALHSAPIEMLRYTRAALTMQMQSKLDGLYNIINPSFNHRGYREALNEPITSGERDRCIPWLPFHLKELHRILQTYPATVQVEGSNLINFTRYTKFTDRIKEVVHYKPPDLEHYRDRGQLAYVERQLRALKSTDTTEEALLARATKLKAKEHSDYRARRPELKALGFRVPR